VTTHAVFAADTGHVLGAVTVNGGPDRAPAVVDLVGDELPLRATLPDGNLVEVPVRASRLNAAAIEDAPGDLFVTPLSFAVATGKALNQPAPAPDVSFNGKTLTVTLQPAPAAATTALVLVSGDRGFQQPVAAGAATVKIAVSLATGEYGVLVLVPGFAARLDRFTVG
jgi:hypothetical protein